MPSSLALWTALRTRSGRAFALLTSDARRSSRVARSVPALINVKRVATSTKPRGRWGAATSSTLTSPPEMSWISCLIWR